MDGEEIMSKIKKRTLSDGTGHARKGIKLALLAQLATVLTVAATVPLVVTGPVLASTQSANIIVSGTVITSSGKADAGATVTLHAWPDQAVITSLKLGQKVPWVLVGTGRADASGKYSISMPVAKLAPEESYGVVNLEADAPSSIYFFPVAVTKNAGDAYLPSANVVANLAASSDLTATPEFPGCAGTGWKYVKYLGKHTGTVGETYVLTSHVSQHFTYEVGQSSSIGVGISGSGSSGSFADEGTFSWSANYGQDYPTKGANTSVWWQTNFKFGEYSCYIPAAAHTWYTDHVNGYAGGMIIKKPTSIPSTPARYCDPLLRGGAAHIDRSAAVTWTRSLGIGTGFGFQASVQTGFDSSAEITYAASANRELCGQYDDPGGTPRQVVVHT
jgi:hypothetical protein